MVAVAVISVARERFMSHLPASRMRTGGPASYKPVRRLSNSSPDNGAERFLLEVRDTLVLQNLRRPLHAPVKRHAHLPPTREHLGILNRCFVQQMVGRHRRVTLDDVERVARGVSRAIGPRLGLE